jgi:glycosyltransferase involved in cell wall biosynthesis
MSIFRKSISTSSPTVLAGSEILFQQPKNALPNIIFIIPTLLVGGAERHTVDLCERLRSRGFQCRIVVHGSVRSDVLTKMSGASDAIFLDLKGMSSFSGWIKTWRVLHSLKPDIVVAVNQSPFIVAVILRFFTWKPFKLACIFHTTKMQVFEQYQEKLLKFFAPWLDLMIYVGTAQKKVWDNRGIKPKNSQIILNGINLNQFQERPASNIRSKLGIQDNEYVLGIVASFRVEKNHTELLQAVALTKSRGVKARILMIGKGGTQQAVKDHAKDLCIDDQIIFIGEQADVRPYILACDVGILCSLIETFPLSVIEFLASGVPVIASHVGGLPEIMEHGVNGLLYETGNVEELTSAILHCFDNEFRSSLSKNTKNSTTHFSVERMSDEYAAAFVGLFPK